MNACIGKTAAGAIWPPPWRQFLKDHPEEARHFKLDVVRKYVARFEKEVRKVKAQ